jgi:hypothetical protein
MLPNLRGLKRFEDAIVAVCDCLSRIGCFEETIEECCADMEMRGGKVTLSTLPRVIREYKTDLIPLKGWFTIEAFIVLRSQVMTNYM